MRKIKKIDNYVHLHDVDSDARKKINELVVIVNKLINKPSTTTNERPKLSEGLEFDKEDLETLYYLLSRTTSKKYKNELNVYLDRIAFAIGR
jgi:hypothetical protein